MKTFSLTEFRRDPVRVLRAASAGSSVAVTRRGRVVFETVADQPPKTLSASDLLGTVKASRHASDAAMKRAVGKGIAEKWKSRR
jgi:antitoxin (DNA-binding transcriptional repressor) of toxin-antitoxin stability system